MLNNFQSLALRRRSKGHKIYNNCKLPKIYNQKCVTFDYNKFATNQGKWPQI